MINYARIRNFSQTRLRPKPNDRSGKRPPGKVRFTYEVSEEGTLSLSVGTVVHLSNGFEATHYPPLTITAVGTGSSGTPYFEAVTSYSFASLNPTRTPTYVTISKVAPFATAPAIESIGTGPQPLFKFSPTLRKIDSSNADIGSIEDIVKLEDGELTISGEISVEVRRRDKATSTEEAWGVVSYSGRSVPNVQSRILVSSSPRSYSHGSGESGFGSIPGFIDPEVQVELTPSVPFDPDYEYQFRVKQFFEPTGETVTSSPSSWTDIQSSLTALTAPTVASVNYIADVNSQEDENIHILATATNSYDEYVVLQAEATVDYTLQISSANTPNIQNLRFYETSQTLNGESIYRSEAEDTHSSTGYWEAWHDGTVWNITEEAGDITLGWKGAAAVSNDYTTQLGSATGTLEVSSGTFYTWFDLPYQGTEKSGVRGPIYDGETPLLLRNTPYRFRLNASVSEEIYISGTETSAVSAAYNVIPELDKAINVTPRITRVSGSLKRFVVTFDHNRRGKASIVQLEYSTDGGSTWSNATSIEGLRGFSSAQKNALYSERSEKIRASNLSEFGQQVALSQAFYRNPTSGKYLLSANVTTDATTVQFRVRTSNEFVEDPLGMSRDSGVPENAPSETVYSDVVVVDLAADKKLNTSVPLLAPVSVTPSLTGYQLDLSWVNGQSNHSANAVYYRIVRSEGEFSSWRAYQSVDAATTSLSNLKVPRGFDLQFKVEAVKLDGLDVGEVEETTAATVSDAITVEELREPGNLQYDISGGDLVFTWTNQQTDHTDNLFRYKSQSATTWTESVLAASTATATISGVVNTFSYVWSINGLKFYDTGDTLNSESVYRSEFVFGAPKNYFELWQNAAGDWIFSYERDDETFGWNFGTTLTDGLRTSETLGDATKAVTLDAITQMRRSLDDSLVVEVIARSGDYEKPERIFTNPAGTGFFWARHRAYGYDPSSLEYVDSYANGGIVSDAPTFYTHLSCINNPYPIMDGWAVPFGQYWSNGQSSPPPLTKLNQKLIDFGPELVVPVYADSTTIPADEGIYFVRRKASSSQSWTGLVELNGQSEGFLRATFLFQLNGEDAVNGTVIDPYEYVWSDKVTVPKFNVEFV